MQFIFLPGKNDIPREHLTTVSCSSWDFEVLSKFTNIFITSKTHAFQLRNRKPQTYYDLLS